MRKSTIALLSIAFAVIAAMPIFVLSPPLDVGDSPGGAKTARHFLSFPAEAGRKMFDGGCADCHGEGGSGGSAPALRDKAFARDFMKKRELHDGVAAPIPGHAGLSVHLGREGGSARFNQVELMGRYLREIQRTAREKGE